MIDKRQKGEIIDAEVQIIKENTEEITDGT